MSSLRRVVFGAVVYALFAVSVEAETPETAARRFLALAYDGQFEALPKAANAQTARFERQIRNLLRVRCLRADQMALTLAGGDAERATVVAEVGLSKRDPLSASKEWTAIEIVPLRVELVREQRRWLVREVQNRDDELAAQLLERAGEERERLLRERPGRVSKGLARAIYAGALADLNSSRFARAADAAALARRIAVEAGDRGGEALALGAAAHAAVYDARPHAPDEPMQWVSEGLSIAQSLDDPDVLARAWYDRGRMAPSNRWKAPAARDGLQASECYANALRIAERAEDPSILIRVLYSLGNSAANAQSDYLTARRYIDRGLELAYEVDDIHGQWALEGILATVYFNQGDRELGLFHNGRAMELAEKAHAFGYTTLVMRWAYTLVENREFDKAAEVLARVLTRKEKGISSAIGPVTASALASCVRALAVVEAERGNLDEAECLIRESVLISGAKPNAYLFELAPYRAARGNHAAALAFALASLSERGLFSYQQVAALLAAGRAYRDLGNVRRALEMALEAIDIREAVDSRIAGGEQQRAIASSATSECYELAAELALAQGDPIRALAFLERGRARVLTDIFDNGRPGAMAEAEAALGKRRDSLDREIARISSDLDRARIAGREPAVTRLTAELGQVRDLRASLTDGLQARGARQRATLRRVDPERVVELAMGLPPRTVALEYFVAEHALHVFVVSRDAAGAPRVICRRMPVERKTLERVLREFAGALAGNDLRIDAAAREAYRLLVQPVESDLSHAEALLIVPDEFIWRVPFAALVDRRGRYLVQRAATVYAPSLTAFTAIVESRKSRATAPESLLAVGNPSFDLGATKAAASFYRDVDLGPLPDAEREVDTVGKLYDRQHSLVLKRDQATETRTKAALGSATIAHFATHAILDDGNPMYSRLMLARDGHDSNDGWLESWEVARLSLQADLVVLSACETGRGKVSGEGVIGLSWAFFLAGADSILATEWKVASDSTADFMIAFHRAFRGPAADLPLHKAQALRRAQLQLLASARTRHPFHWAPFVLMGDPARR